MSQIVNILPAMESNRQDIIGLLQAEKLPVDDLPVALNNFFVASVNQVIVGAAGIELYERYGLLRSLVVNGNYRNLSIAAKLVEEVERKSVELQLVGIYLLTETAQGYFERKGYAVINRGGVPLAVQQSSEFSHVCPVSAVVMRKEIALG